MKSNKLNLTDRNIKAAVEAALTELESIGVLRDDHLRFGLSLEELLLEYRDVIGEDGFFSVNVRKKYNRVQVEVEVEGREYNVLTCPDSMIQVKVQHGWGSKPEYKYVSGRNRVIYVFRLHNSFLDNLRFTWEYTGPYKKHLFLAVVLQFISVVLMIIAPMLSAKIIVSFTDNEIHQLVFIAGMLLFIEVLNTAVLSGCNWAYNVVYNKSLTVIEEDISTKVLRLTSNCIDSNGSGLFIKRLTTDTSNLASAITSLADNISQVCQYVGILIAMLYISPLVFCVTVLFLTIQTAIELKRERRAEKNGRVFRNADERYTGMVGEIVHGARDIKLVHAEANVEKELIQRIKSSNDSRMYVDYVNRVYKFFLDGVVAISGFLFVILLAALMLNGSLQLATVLILFNYYTSLGTPAIMLLGTILDFVTEFNLSAERLSMIKNDAVFPKEEFGTVTRNDIRGEIIFDHVLFSYNIFKHNSSIQWVLYDMSFRINPGETVAFVGESGCGKTTVFNLISRMYDAFSGKVLIDGINIKEYDRDSLRGCMSVVTQSPYIFNMSIRDNLKLAKPDMTDDEMKRVLTMTCMDKDIEAMPGQYDAIIGEAGVNLSGGQRQRLAIARCLLRDSRIILLDEATSALDNVTQEKIRESLFNIRGNATMIIVAHRLSTIIGADRIFFVKNGKILAEGTHDELIVSCPDYRTLYETESRQR